MKTCPFCGEEIQDAAVKCKHCKAWLNKPTSQAMPSYKSPSNRSSSAVATAIGATKKALIFLSIIFGLSLLPHLISDSPPKPSWEDFIIIRLIGLAIFSGIVFAVVWVYKSLFSR